MVNAVRLEELKAPTLAQSFITRLLGVPEPAPEVKKEDDGMLDDVHCVMTSKTHLNFLADVFDLKEAIYSVGDFLLMLGEWLWSFVPIVWVTLILKKVWDELVA